MLELPFGEIDLAGMGAELEAGASVLAERAMPVADDERCEERQAEQ